MHLWNRQKKEVRRKKGRISWRLSLWLQRSERGKTSLYLWVTGNVKCSHRERERMRERQREREWERETERGTEWRHVFLFFLDHLCFMSVAQKNKDEVFVNCAHSPTRGNTLWPHVTHKHTRAYISHQLSYWYNVLITSLSSQVSVKLQ